MALARRDRPGREGKSFLPQAGLAATVADLLVDIQKSMLERATAFRDSHIFDPKDYAELTEVVQNGWAYSYWCESPECETKVKEDTKATTRCMPLDRKKVPASVSYAERMPNTRCTSPRHIN